MHLLTVAVKPPLIIVVHLQLRITYLRTPTLVLYIPIPSPKSQPNVLIPSFGLRKWLHGHVFMTPPPTFYSPIGHQWAMVVVQWNHRTQGHNTNNLCTAPSLIELIHF